MALLLVMSDRVVGVRHPASRLQHDGETERWKSAHLLYQCLTWSQSTHYHWVILFFHLSLSAAHSADKVLDSLQCSFFFLFFSPCKKKKKQQLKSALQNQCHPHICGFQSQLDSDSLTAAVVDAVVSEHLCSKAEGGSMATQAGGLLCAWPLVLVSLNINT